MNEQGENTTEAGNSGLTEFLTRSQRAWLHDAIRARLRVDPAHEDVHEAMNAAPAIQPAVVAFDHGSIVDVAAGVFAFHDGLDIWVSAGPRGPNTESCDQSNTENCRIYRIRWSTKTNSGRAVLVLDMTALGYGTVSPTVNRGGQRLAVTLNQGWDPAGFPNTVSLAMYVQGSVYVPQAYVAVSALRPARPAWWNAEWLLWGANAQENGTLDWWGNIHAAHVSRAGVVHGLLIGGPDQSNAAGGAPGGVAPCLATNAWPTSDCASWRDPDVHEDPPGLPAGDWVTVFGNHGIPQPGVNPANRGSPDIQTVDAKPIVARLPFGTDIQEFDLGAGRDGKSIAACHHSAWNVSGSEILCTRQDPKDVDTYKTLIIPRHLKFRALYGYTFNGTGWSAPAAGREVVESTDLTVDLPKSFKPADVVDGSLITYKFAHWCGSDQYVVATVFATFAEVNVPVTSRVILFDTQTPQQMWDLTDVIEDLEGATRGDWRAIFSACDASSP